MSKSKNLFATVLTYPAPSSNYRGESEENRTMLQKITKGGKEFVSVNSFLDTFSTKIQAACFASAARCS